MSLVQRQTVLSEANPVQRAAPQLQRACSCGESAGVSGKCGTCAAQDQLEVQPKLTVNTPGDRYEQEADRIAARVIAGPAPAPASAGATGLQRETAEEEEDLQRMPEGRQQEIEDEEEIQTKPAGLQREAEEDEELQRVPDSVQREVQEEEDQTTPAELQREAEEEEELQTKASGSHTPSTPAIGQAVAAVSGDGAPLSRAERGFFEPRLGRDLSGVRLHDDARAGAAARGINARAYTLRNHIAFAPGARDFGSTEGRRLMAHELVHTAQQAEHPHGLQREAVPKDYAKTVPEADTSDADLETEEVKAAFIFDRGEYGREARRYIKAFYPDHLLFGAHSFEGLFAKLFRVLEKSRARGQNPHLQELIIVSHGNAAGGLQIPLVEGKKKNFNMWTLSELQQDFRDGLHEKYQSKRSAVVSDLIDTDTKVIVRACEFGQSPEALHALRAFLGGAPTVWAPKGVQGYETVEIGKGKNQLLRTPQEAFEFLMDVDYLPDHLMQLAEEEKHKYLARVFGFDGGVPSVFFVMGDKDYDEMKVLKKNKRHRGKEAEKLKHREEAGRPSRGEYWQDADLRYREVPDYDLLPLSIDEIEGRARALLADYRPEIAYMILRLRDEWERKTTLIVDELPRDPLSGIPPVEIFGGSEVERDAERFPGPTIDAFEVETIVPPESEPPYEYLEGLGNGSDGAGGGRARRSGSDDMPPGRAAAEDFSKSHGTAKPKTEPDNEPLRIEDVLAQLSGDVDRRLAESFLSKLPKEGWAASEYVSATELTVNAVSNVIIELEIGGAVGTAGA
ncbi:MAG: DUF4157 domain-containing protein, partial [Pseudomonadota bacterium]